MTFKCRYSIVLLFSFLITFFAGAPVQAAPLAYFLQAHGPAAEPVMILGWVLTGICVTVCLVITILLIIALTRRREKAQSERINEDEKPGLRWIRYGTVFSFFILLGMVVYTLITYEQVSSPHATPVLEINVIGHNWWWEIIYNADDPEERFTTANEIHIPVGKPVLIHLKSADVIHAFWIPQLAGKTQMIPGLLNRQWIQADQPGRYRGTCVQFCGSQHAHMGVEVVAQKEEDFQNWLEAQAQPVSPPIAAQALAGQKMFKNRCSGCHTVNANAASSIAPDLSHLQSRRLIAAGMLENTPENLKRWITRAQDIKPGAYMPNITLSEEERKALVDYLETLK